MGRSAPLYIARLERIDSKSRGVAAERLPFGHVAADVETSTKFDERQPRKEPLLLCRQTRESFPVGSDHPSPARCDACFGQIPSSPPASHALSKTRRRRAAE